MSLILHLVINWESIKSKIVTAHIAHICAALWIDNLHVGNSIHPT